ncbi:MAG: ATP-binding cassette domain-containing protein [Ilumatobacter sp.]|uniref:ABC transporter ATP-binding protein n=1 Tax=Ilumatobacter sp. TaxID=1967498 RepID=UPI002615A833|nr:ATP-binding cassette domain-containing protein [Ilumatobacter sp.]MDJ0769608.1 ATP-binding cassette domain-containing protein [Ilumatobacter sp.]
MAEVRYEAASRIYPGTDIAAVDSLDLEIEDGELLVLVGPSGSGKSTALRMLAGLEHVNEGSIYIDGDDVTLTPPQDRDIAMVFQNYALYPSMTVAENMGFALKQAKVPKAQRMEQVREAARILDLEEYLDRKPKNLSGGQRQRVAMGRAIVRHPKVFLMDEPLSNLDAKLRVQTRTELADLQARLGVTTVYVTHDQVEAMTMGHRVAVLNFGVLQQVDRPSVLYSHPVNRFVAGFIGSPAMNLLDADAGEDGALTLGGVAVPLEPDVTADLRERGPGRYTVGVRPEHLQLGADGIAGEVTVVEELGSEAFLHVAIQHEGESTVLVVRDHGETSTKRGDTVHVGFDGPTHVFAPDGGRVGG